MSYTPNITPLRKVSPKSAMGDTILLLLHVYTKRVFASTGI